MVNLRADTRESIAKLTLMDDIFMNKVFENDTERTALLLRIILNNDKIKVVKAVTQQKLKNTPIYQNTSASQKADVF